MLELALMGGVWLLVAGLLAAVLGRAAARGDEQGRRARRPGRISRYGWRRRGDSDDEP